MRRDPSVSRRSAIAPPETQETGDKPEGRTDQDDVFMPLELVAHLAEEEPGHVRRRERVVPLLLLLLRARGVRAEVGRRQAGLVLQRGAQADLELEGPWCTYARGRVGVWDEELRA